MRRGLAWRYPDRKRCARCRRYFGFLVVKGLWCSYACARLPNPALVLPDDWPREHYSKRGGVRRPKRAWRDQRAAERAAKLNGKQAYVCGFCNEWHIGTSRSAASAEGSTA